MLERATLEPRELGGKEEEDGEEDFVVLVLVLVLDLDMA
tara:strand:- start:134 stop:250 length:117 start_codon:yes stop_codon:yes gene_type:complete